MVGLKQPDNPLNDCKQTIERSEPEKDWTYVISFLAQALWVWYKAELESQ